MEWTVLVEAVLLCDETDDEIWNTALDCTYISGEPVPSSFPLKPPWSFSTTYLRIPKMENGHGG